MIPLGILAAAGAGGETFELINTTTLLSNQSSVTFNVSALSGTYKHLQLRVAARDTQAIGQTAELITFNGDTSANYSMHRVISSGGGLSVYPSTSANYILTPAISGASSTSSAYGAFILDIVDAFSSSKYKSTRAIGGNTGTNNEIAINSGSWRNTAPITSITITSSNLLTAYSRFSLYGVRG
jgi:hypothetical protein